MHRAIAVYRLSTLLLWALLTRQVQAADETLVFGVQLTESGPALSGALLDYGDGLKWMVEWANENVAPLRLGGITYDFALKVWDDGSDILTPETTLRISNEIVNDPEVDFIIDGGVYSLFYHVLAQSVLW